MRSYVRAGISLASCYGAGFIGSLFVSSTSGSWYAAISKPWFNPPSWVFAPVWLTLYALMAIALMLVWSRDPLAKDMRGWVPLFFAHLLLNAAWTVFFFGLHAVFIAMIDIGLLVFCVFTLMMSAWEIDKRATYLLAPYFLWISFATLLNVSIWYLN